MCMYISETTGAIKDGDQAESTKTTRSHPTKSSLDPKLNRNSQIKSDQSNVSNPTQLRRSPRKKVSTASIVNAAYRTERAKLLPSNTVADGRSSVYSGDTNSVISNKKSLPNSGRSCAKQGNDEIDGSKLDINERGDNRATRSGRLRGNTAGVTQVQNSQAHNLTGNVNENFKQKLRNAVYDALISKEIGKDNKVTKTALDRLEMTLFWRVKMYNL